MSMVIDMFMSPIGAIGAAPPPRIRHTNRCDQDARAVGPTGGGFYTGVGWGGCGPPWPR